MESESVQILPGVGQMVMSLAHKHGMNVTAAFRELIDNSLDAAAGSIVIQYSRAKSRLVISDDGKGTCDVEDIVTPYKHRDHASTLSGRFGIGGTVSQIWLTSGGGTVRVESRTAADAKRGSRAEVSTINVDFRKVVQTDRFEAQLSRAKNVSGLTGTTIELTGCMEINSNHVGSVYRELAFTFAPALRKGVSIVVNVDGKEQVWQPYLPPARVARQPINVQVDGHTVKGFCDLVRPGETNRAKGWAVEFGHRFLGVFSDPAGDQMVDLGLIYSEVRLPRTWKNINDHKDGFVEPPVGLWKALAEASAPILNRAQTEGRMIELKASVEIAQQILDTALGRGGPLIKERRPGKGVSGGTATSTGSGPPRRNFSVVQPGDKASRPRDSLPQRILIRWATGLKTSYEVRFETNLIRVLLSPDHPTLEKYRGENAGPFLADFVLLVVASDWKTRKENYLSLFPDSEAEDIPAFFDELRARVIRSADVPKVREETA